ncbi:MAG TPA: hypothetical protein VGB13_06520 [Candidatus Krumholzibacteria bacterium]
MRLLKGCQRCQGDLFVEREHGDADLVCLQCGYRRPVSLQQLPGSTPSIRPVAA